MAPAAPPGARLPMHFDFHDMLSIEHSAGAVQSSAPTSLRFCCRH
jgi:hypothetical protein